MSNLGLGVMINMLGGNKRTVEAFRGALNKEIKQLEIVDDSLRFSFTDDTKISMYDDGQSCCENRWMHTDDDLDYYIGSTLMDAEIADGEETNQDYDEVKESQFLKVKTSKGVFTVVNYNEHNGYYGGFSLVVR